MGGFGRCSSSSSSLLPVSAGAEWPLCLLGAKVMGSRCDVENNETELMVVMASLKVLRTWKKEGRNKIRAGFFYLFFQQADNCDHAMQCKKAQGNYRRGYPREERD